MSKYEEEAKKKRITDVYSSTYNNGGWSKRDALPTGDPIGDIVEEEQDIFKPQHIFKIPEEWAKKAEEYHKKMKERSLHPKGKFIMPVEAIPVYGMLDPKHNVEAEACCDKPHRYKNIISQTLKFWSCKNCGADLGDIE